MGHWLNPIGGPDRRERGKSVNSSHGRRRPVQIDRFLKLEVEAAFHCLLGTPLRMTSTVNRPQVIPDLNNRDYFPTLDTLLGTEGCLPL